MPILKVALTGGIACGKSIVAAYFKKKGCWLHRADQVAHRLIEPKKPAWKAIVEHFGPKILNSDGTINRQELGRIVFSDPTEREILNQILHPLVLKKKKEALRRLERAGKSGIFVAEAALTIEAGFVPYFDKIVVVFCPEELQIERLMARNNLTREEAVKRLESQMPVRKKLEYADYVIDTSGTIEATLAQAEKVYQSLQKDLKAKKAKKSAL